MPTYEYQCRLCGERLEVFQSFSAKSLTSHKGCGGDLHKVFHPSGVVFKGSGYYVNDSRSSQRSSGSSPNGDSDSPSQRKADSPEKKASESAKTSDSSQPSEKKKSDSKSTSEAAAS